jgi:hypothetical protein
MIGPMIAVWLLKKTGSWMPLFTATAAVQILAGVFFQMFATTESARDILTRQHEHEA